MRIAFAALILVALTAAQPAHAQRRPPACTIDSATPVVFGLYEPESGSPRTSTGRLTFRCSSLALVTVRVSIGPSAVSGSINDRQMGELAGSDRLHYNLYRNQAGTQIWGDGITGGTPASITGRTRFEVEVYGVIRAGQQVSEGLYGDRVRITIMP